MAKIRPFKGMLYNQKRFSDPSLLLAPPYDVVSKDDRDRIVAAEPYNVFRLDLPDLSDCLGQEPAAGDKYQCAARILRKWLEQDVLLQEGKPAIYPYSIDFKVNGNSYRRKGFITLVRADDWLERTILPHEKTFNKVTEDRFHLRVATRAQFSHIFMIYRHISGLSDLLSGPASDIFSVQDAMGNTHTLSRISDASVTTQVAEAFSRHPLYIADGHHRYTTAINYRKEMARRFGDDSGEDPLYQYTMAYLVDVDDPGLIVLPTHRLVRMPQGLTVQDAEARLSQFFHIREVAHTRNGSSETVRLMKEAMAAEDVQSIGFMAGVDNGIKLLSLKPEAREKLLKITGHRELADLDVVMLEQLAFGKALNIDVEELEVGRDLFYEADSQRAVEHLGPDLMLFFMNPTQAEQVLNVADAGLTMPHKSTFFYPKILTGIVMHLEQMPGR